MFSLGSTEILVIVMVALLLFGPDKIPQMARTVGRFMREFNKYKDIMESTIRMEIAQADTTPAKDELTLEQRIAKAGDASTADIERSKLEAAGAAGAADDADAESELPSPGVVARPSADESDEEDEG